MEEGLHTNKNHLWNQASSPRSRLAQPARSVLTLTLGPGRAHEKAVGRHSSSPPPDQRQGQELAALRWKGEPGAPGRGSSLVTGSLLTRNLLPVFPRSRRGRSAGGAVLRGKGDRLPGDSHAQDLNGDQFCNVIGVLFIESRSKSAPWLASTVTTLGSVGPSAMLARGRLATGRALALGPGPVGSLEQEGRSGGPCNCPLPTKIVNTTEIGLSCRKCRDEEQHHRIEGPI